MIKNLIGIHVQPVAVSLSNNRSSALNGGSYLQNLGQWNIFGDFRHFYIIDGYMSAFCSIRRCTQRQLATLYAHAAVISPNKRTYNCTLKCNTESWICSILLVEVSMPENGHTRKRCTVNKYRFGVVVEWRNWYKKLSSMHVRGATLDWGMPFVHEHLLLDFACIRLCHCRGTYIERPRKNDGFRYSMSPMTRIICTSVVYECTNPLANQLILLSFLRVLCYHCTICNIPWKIMEKGHCRKVGLKVIQAVRTWEGSVQFGKY